MCPQHLQLLNKNRFANKMPVTPDDNHVVCGRGKVNAKFPGNKKFASIVSESLLDYMNANSRIEKIVIVTSVTSRLYDCGLKFVMFDASTQNYTELSSERVHDKVSHAIRDQIRQHEISRVRRESTCTTTDSSTKANSEEGNHLKMKTKSDLASTINQSNKKRPAISTSAAQQKFDRPSLVIEQLQNPPAHKKMRSAASILPIDKTTLPTKGLYAATKKESEFAEEFLGFPDTIFDLGTPVEETTISGNGNFPIFASNDIIIHQHSPTTSPPWSDIPIPEEIKSKAVTDETNALALSVQSLSPLPVDAETKFEYHDIRRVCVILLDQGGGIEQRTPGTFQHSETI